MCNCTSENLEIPGLVLTHHPGMTSCVGGMRRRPIAARVIICHWNRASDLRPPGKSLAAHTCTSPLSTPARKNISVFPKPKSPYIPCRPVPQRGVSRSSRTLERDAMDASGVTDESACPRTAKSCGPDAPTLASSWRRCFASRWRWWQESPVTRESPKETVKTIAQGNAGCLRRTCGDYARVVFVFTPREAAGAAGTRHSLRPRFRGEGFLHDSDAIAPRGCGSVCLSLFSAGAILRDALRGSSG